MRAFQTSAEFSGRFFMRVRRGLAFLLLTAALPLGSFGAEVASTHPHKSPKKPPQLAPLPSGPRGPVPALPLDTMQPVAPQVSYRDGQLTIIAPNSTLGDILRAVRKQTSADIEIPPTASERVVTHIGPGPARDVVAELLNGSKFNYVLLGSPANASQLTRVVLVAKSGSDNVTGGVPPQTDPNQANMAPPPDPNADAPDAEPQPEEAQDDSADQNANADAEPPPVEQPGIKTPQQMLQEMQQRQLQMQQQLAPGQPPIPGGGIPQLPQPQQ
jgi:hypothetical protein